VHAASAQTVKQQVWEYKRIRRVFKWKDGEIIGVNEWYEDGEKVGGPADNGMQLKLVELGSQG
jgi:hypothetical protein